MIFRIDIIKIYWRGSKLKAVNLLLIDLLHNNLKLYENSWTRKRKNELNESIDAMHAWRVASTMNEWLCRQNAKVNKFI